LKAGQRGGHLVCPLCHFHLPMWHSLFRSAVLSVEHARYHEERTKVLLGQEDSPDSGPGYSVPSLLKADWKLGWWSSFLFGPLRFHIMMEEQRRV
jgi:hypothetical protein